LLWIFDPDSSSFNAFVQTSPPMPAQRSTYPRRRSNPESRTSLATQRNGRRLQPADSLEPGIFHDDVATPVGSREVSTEPATPPLPILGSRSYRRALRRERSARFVHAVFHYNRSSNDLKPWFWYGHSSPSIDYLTTFTPQASQQRRRTGYPIQSPRVP
jgi:hypothetical protein